MKILAKFVKHLCCAATLLGLFAVSQNAFAQRKKGVAELGVKFYSGEDTNSVTGSLGYFLGIGAESPTGMFRPNVTAILEMISGTASIAADTPAFTMYAAEFDIGLRLYIFKEGKLLPFVGASGIMGWGIFKMTTPPTGIDKNTLGLVFGYHVCLGMDIFFSGNDSSMRISSYYRSLSGGLAGQSGFGLGSFGLNLGKTF